MVKPTAKKKTYVFIGSGECVDAVNVAEAIEKLSRWYPRLSLNEDTVVTENAYAAVLREERRMRDQGHSSWGQEW